MLIAQAEGVIVYKAVTWCELEGTEKPTPIGFYFMCFKSFSFELAMIFASTPRRKGSCSIGDKRAAYRGVVLQAHA